MAGHPASPSGRCYSIVLLSEGQSMNESTLLPEEIERIINFQGYGIVSAPVWFIGIEEGLGKMSDDDANRNLKARGSFETVMDLRVAHLRLRERGQLIDVETKQSFTQVWQYMAKVMLAHNGDKNWSDLSFAEQYIRFRLGRNIGNGGETFLTELSPIPSNKSGNKEWYLWFKARLGQELERKLEMRKQELKRIFAEQILKDKVSRLVVCYSRPRADEFARLLGIEWKPVPSCPRVCAASRDSARYLLLPFFGYGQMGHQVIADLLDSGHLGLPSLGLSSVGGSFRHDRGPDRTESKTNSAIFSGC